MKPTSSKFAHEAEAHLFAFCFAAIISAAYLLYAPSSDLLDRASFPFLVTGVFLICCGLEHIFALFVSGRISALFSLIPWLVLLPVIRSIEVLYLLQPAIVLGVLLRLCVRVLPHGKRTFIPGTLCLDAAALYLFFYHDQFGDNELTSRLLCIFLVILTMSAAERTFFAQRSSAYPIHLFLFLALSCLFVPMASKPIDWTPVERAGERIVSGLERAADNIAYYFASNFGNGYMAGYSSFGRTGEKLDLSKRNQLLIETRQLPYHTFTDEETGTLINLRKTLYLSGGQGADEVQFAGFLGFLYQNGVDRGKAFAFSDTELVTLEYRYLDTRDEIVPSTAFLVTHWGDKVHGGQSGAVHHKGYRLDAQYLDIDYGSAELIELYRAASSAQGYEGAAPSAPDYYEASSYARELWNLDLSEVLSEDEYDSALKELTKRDADVRDEYMDASGSDARLSDLAEEVTRGCTNDYDKCRRIEEYLRQFAYTRDAVGGYNASSDMSSAEGMADIAERFLFDTGKGYCVHFTSAMVMMLRLSGIPARAVTGYRYAFPFEVADEYPVSSSCAHTWPEAYIPGAGWIPFEPTSGYYALSANTWHRSSGSSKELPGHSSALPAPAVTAVSDTTPEDQDAAVESSLVLALKVLWPFVLSAALIVLLLFVGSRLLRALRYRLSSPAQKLLWDVELIKKDLAALSGTTVSDRGFLSDYLPLAPAEMKPDLESIFRTSYRILYGPDGNNTPTTAENDLARALRDNLRQRHTGRRKIEDSNEFLQ